MMKCDMCYDRTSVGKRPMCATVCPSQALFFGTREQIEKLRPSSRPTNRFRFGNQQITTGTHMMLPRRSQAEYIDVADALEEESTGKTVHLDVMAAAIHHDGDTQS